MKNMIKINSLILIFILLFNMIFPILSIAAVDAVSITFQDEKLYYAILEKIESTIDSKSDSTYTIAITQKNLNSIDTLRLNLKQIVNISGLENFTNLKYLSLSSNDISDISVLNKLTKLETLNLEFNEIYDISVLNKLTNLTLLNISSNNISDISALSKLTNLEYLNISSNNINDISPLNTLTKLNILQMEHLTATNISPIENLSNLEKINLNYSNIENLEALSNLTNLKFISFFKSNLSNVDFLAPLTNITDLCLSYNNIEDITAIGNLTSLKVLSITNNNICDISPLANCTNSEELYLCNNNIKNINALSALTDCYITISNNHIDDLEVLNNSTIDFCFTSRGYYYLPGASSGVEISSHPQSLSILTNKRTIELPKIFLQARKAGSKFYSSSNFKLVNCTLSQDCNSLILNEDVNEATIEIISGNVSGTKLTVTYEDNIPPELEVNYSTKELTNETVTVSISSNEEIQQIEGWSLEDDKMTLKKVYSKNAQEEIDVYDIAGNKSTAKVEITNIDTTAPQAEINYSTTKLTNNNVTATITANEEIQQVDGWTLSDDKLTLIKEFESNTTEELIIYDLTGNEKKITININNIDKNIPIINISYNTLELTNSTITATITSNKELQQLEGWTLSDDSITLTKIYAKNTEEEFTIYDLAGNSTKASISINNIDTSLPQAEINYSTTKLTNNNVIVTITSNEEIQQVEGWILSDDNLRMTKEFESNTKENLKIYDLAGNEKNLIIEIKNIDKDIPTVKTQYSTKEITNDTVTVTITSNEEIQQVEEWTLSDDGTSLTKTYIKNDEEEIIIYDLAGNSTKTNISIKNIDTIAPEAEIKYSTTKFTKDTIIVTIVANEEIKPIEGWKLSDDNLSMTKEYNDNIEEDIIIYDLAGNERKLTVEINNIIKDDTTSNTILPNAGQSPIIIMSIIFVLGIIIILYKKLKNLKDVK